MSARRLTWGSPNDDALPVDPDVALQSESQEYTFLGRGSTTGALAGPATEEGLTMIPGERVIRAVDDDGTSTPIAIASEDAAGSRDVLNAVAEEWRLRSSS